MAKRPAGPFWESHRREAEEEDVAFVMETTGCSFLDACARVGADPSTLRVRAKRAGRPYSPNGSTASP